MLQTENPGGTVLDRHIVCPDCGGKKKTFQFVDGTDPKTNQKFGYSGYFACSLCNGSGEITPELAARIERGRAARDRRVSANVNARDEAKRLGVDRRELSHFEFGREVDPAALEKILAGQPMEGMNTNG